MKILHDHIVYQLRLGNRRWRPFGPFLGYLVVFLAFVVVYGWLFLFLMEAEGRHSTLGSLNMAPIMVVRSFRDSALATTA